MSDVAELEKIDRIKAAFARDERDQPQALTLDDIPAFYECITPQWLTAVVRKKYPDATVTGYTLDVRDSGTTNRRRIFLEYGAQDQNRGYPASLFCKGAQDLANRITMSAGSSLGEVLFYQEIRPQIEFDAPFAYFAAFDPDSCRSIIVFDDMASDVEFCTYASPVSRARAESQIDLLARMHGRFYDSPELKTGALGAMDTFPMRFEKLDRYHGLADACYRGLIASAPVVPAALVDRIEEVWPRTLESIARLKELPHTLTHGDVHLGNWYVRPDDQMGLTDFQNGTRGHFSRDLAYTISTSLEVEDRRAWERDLITLYLERLQHYSGRTETFDETWKNYRQQLLSVLAYWTVTLTPSPSMAQDMQTEATTLAFLGRIGHAVDDLGSLDAFD